MMLKHLYRFLFAVWLLWGGISSPAYAFGAAQPSSWGSTSDVPPAYQFRSTSTLPPVVGSSSYSSEIFSPGAKSPSYRPNRATAGYWNSDGEWDEDGNPIGVVPDPAPVGEPFVLLAMAALYVLCLALRRRWRTN